MLCPSCNKFATYDTGAEPELDLELSKETCEVTGTARIVLTSECCGDELKEATFDVQIDFEDELKAAVRKKLDLGPDEEVNLDDWEMELRDESAELTERRETTSRKTLKSGKVVERNIPFRYQKQFYGVSVQCSVRATKGDDEVDVDLTFDDDVQASGMDELT